MPNSNFYRGIRKTEIDMRQEVINFLDGSYPEIPKKQPAILRRMRRDSDDNLIPCACVDDVTGEPDKDTFCLPCYGEGWYWDEVYLDVYKVIIKSDVGNALRERAIAPSLANIPIVVFYADYAETITKDDKIVELRLDNAGNIVQPAKRTAVYRIATLFPFRADNGRLEYYKIATYEEDIRFLNGASG
jgi:hypothetical protein